MAKVCFSCGKGPAFGNSRSHSMVATRRRFDPNLQKVRIDDAGHAAPRLRLRPLPEGQQGHQGRLEAARGISGRRPRGNGPMADPSIERFRRVVATASRPPRGAPPGDQRPQRVPGRRRRHRGQHGADDAGGDGGARPARRSSRSTRSGATRSSTPSPDAALMGARGNSGVILSQIVRGAAEELASAARASWSTRFSSAAAFAERRRRGLRLGPQPRPRGRC